MGDRYTFPNTDRGHAMRSDVAFSLRGNGITYREYTEQLEFDGGTCILLKLEVTGKRPDEGKIAAAMKARKA